ncbi:MAG: hypothetical protein AAF692_11150 [Pseudomonadota bacterium]
MMRDPIKTLIEEIKQLGARRVFVGISEVSDKMCAIAGLSEKPQDVVQTGGHDSTVTALVELYSIVERHFEAKREAVQ